MEDDAMKEKIKIALVYGSTRPGRFCDTVAGWTAAELEKRGGFEVLKIDPAQPGGEGDGALGTRIAEADAFVVVTPEYNHGYPAALKSLIDSFGPEWHAKPVGFVSYGGVSGGLRAVEQLRLVFAELHAVTLRDSVSFQSPWEQFDSAGGLRAPERAQRSLDTMLGRLEWWAGALRRARTEVPYLAAA